MSFNHHLIRSTQPTSWRWPLHAGLVKGRTEDKDALLKQYWTPQFCDISLDLHSRKFDLALVNDSVIKAISYLSELYFHAAVVIVRTTKEDIGKLRLNPLLAGNFTALLAKTKASGIFIIATDTPLDEWFEQFIVSLCHNNNLVDALEQTAAEGYFIYDDTLKTEAKLSFVLDQLVAYLHTLSNQDQPAGNTAPDSPDHMLSPPPSPAFMMGILELMVLDKDPAEIYNSEKRAATTVAQISNMLRDTGNYPPPHPQQQRNITGPSAPAEPSAANKSAETGAARFLQSKILGAGSNEPPPALLEYETTYVLQVRIGLPELTWNNAPRSFPGELVFDNNASQTETIHIIFTYQSGELLQEQDLQLPRYGNSNPISFEFRTAVSGETFTAEIYAYHKQRLLQKLVLEVPMRNSKPGKGIRITEVFCARKELNNLDARIDFGTTLFYDKSKGNDGRLSGLTRTQPINLNIPKALEKMLQDIRDDIENAIVDIDNHPPELAHPNNVALLTRLALKGNLLFVNHLKRMELAGPLQIVTSREEYIPLDFIYTYPPPNPAGVLCPNATQALEAGACMNCMDKHKSPAPYVCPFGFLGLSQVIERHTTEAPGSANADYSIRAEPSAGRDVLAILDNTLFASSTRVGAATPQLLNDIEQSIRSHALHPQKVDKWEDWTTATQKDNPDTQIMLVHIEPHPVAGIDQIEIGDEDLLLQNLLDDTKIKPIPFVRSPFVIIIGCETMNLQSHGFDISSQLINYGAAMVLSNFTKIRGRHAGRILIELMELLKKNAGKEMILGEVMLQLKQQLLAQGMMAALALTAQGDADWKITTNYV